MYQALQSAFEQTGIEWAACYQEDRGDGLFVLAPATTEKALFSGSFPLTLSDRLHTHNKTHEPEEGIRLRMALHAGEVEDDQHGVAGTALNQAFRLVEAAQLKAALRSSAGVLAVIASSWFYGDVIRHRKEFRPDTYLPVMVNEKETTTVGWVALPEPSVQGACDLHVHAGGLVLAGVQVRMRGPRPAGKQRAVHDVLRPPVQVISHRNIFFKHLTQQWCHSRDRTADCRLGNSACLGQFCLDPVAAHVCQGDGHRPKQSENRRPRPLAAHCFAVDHRTEVHDVFPGKASGRMHVRRLVFVSVVCGNSILSINEPSFMSTRRTGAKFGYRE
jgi:hypothetical protein